MKLSFSILKKLFWYLSLFILKKFCSGLHLFDLHKKQKSEWVWIKLSNIFLNVSNKTSERLQGRVKNFYLKSAP